MQNSFGAVWYNHFFNPGTLVKSETGIRVVHGGLLMCSVALPARSLCTNMKQFNGKYSCVYCKNPGVSRDGMLMVRNWPPGIWELRTHSSFVEDAREAICIASREAVCSLKLNVTQMQLYYVSGLNLDIAF